MMYLVVALALTFIVILTRYKKNRLRDVSGLNESCVSGSFIELAKGRVYYNRYGKKGKNTVVLVHGIFTPSFVWDSVVDTLVGAGHEVISYDLYGRGYSDRLHEPYNEQLYNEQLLNLLDELGITYPIDLVGYSLGGGIAVSFTSRYPERVKKLGLIAPTGFMSEMPLLGRMVRVPVLGAYLCHLVGPTFVLRRLKMAFIEGKITSSALRRAKDQFSYKGTIDSFLSTEKHYPYNALKNSYDVVGRSGIPVVLIWGQKDEMIFFKFSDKVMMAIPCADFHPILDARHSITYTDSEIVGPILRNFVGV